MTAPFAAALPSDADYVSPAHLRTPFRSFLVTYDRGLFWLRMPAGTGKTQFVRGIIARKVGKDGTPEGIDSAISSGARTLAVGLAPGADGAAFVAALKEAFVAEFGVPAPDPGAAGEAPEAFAQWLGALGAEAAGHGAKRLIICIDGLEAGESGAGQKVVDLLPPLASVPAGVMLLLTSRTAEDWPDGRFAAAAAKFTAAPGVGILDVGLADPDYVEAQRRLFVERLRPLLRARCNALLLSLMERRASYDRGGRDPRLTADPTLRDALKDDWKKLTNKFPRYGGQQLPVAPLTPLLDQFERLWSDLLARTEGRASYLFPLVRSLADGTLQVEEVEALPQGSALEARLAGAAA